MEKVLAKVGLMDKDHLVKMLLFIGLKNKSRGQNYIKNIDKYVKSIKYKEIHTKKISSFKIPKDNLSLLLIDVQGFELEVLKGMNWNNSPDFIVYEDDLKIYNNKSNLIRKILKKKGYVYLGGKYDKIFSKKLVICQISLANNIPVIKENYYNFNKLYNNLLFFIICPENQLKIFKKSLNEKNIRIISEDKIIKFSKFKRLFR